MMNIVNKKDLNVLNKMDLRIVPFDYLTKDNENVFKAYIFGNIPIMLASKTINKEIFSNMVK